MELMNKKELKQHYLDSIYTVFVVNKKHEIKIGETVPTVINELLKKAKTAVILTAWNPRSQPFSLQENKSRNNYLRVSLMKNNFSIFDALGEGKDESDSVLGTGWPAEESFFILGIAKEEIENLVVEYGQNAYVWLEYDKPAALEFSSIWMSLRTE